MAPHDALIDDEPPAINPYEVLELERGADEKQIKTAYRKAALKHHPDKVAEADKDEATRRFQCVAFAYTILSDPGRRKRYDETGSTAEAIDSEDFNWRKMFRDLVSIDAINIFSKQYKGSDEEKDDILAAYTEFEGDMDGIYETVMLSNVLDDDERIRKIIDDAIASKEVEAFRAYTKETKKSKQARIKAARSEANEADEMAEELGVYEKLRGKKSKKESEDNLAVLIQQKQASRADEFERFAEKYGAKPGKKGGKKVLVEEPDIPDDEFEALQAKMVKEGKLKAKKGGKKGGVEEPDLADAVFEAFQAKMVNGGKLKAKKKRPAEEPEIPDEEFEALQAKMRKSKKKRSA